METEIEAKFADVDPEQVRAKLRSLGAKLIHPERILRRKQFDYPDHRLLKKAGWIRIRDEGNKITLNYKELQDRTLHGTKEVEVEVSDFTKTEEFLLAIGLQNFTYHETKREEWRLGDCEVVIDTWPWVPPFVEIEAQSEEIVRSTAAELGLDWSKALHGSVEIIYQQHFDVTEEEIDTIPSITFVPVPASLEAKRRS